MDKNSEIRNKINDNNINIFIEKFIDNFFEFWVTLWEYCNWWCWRWKTNNRGICWNKCRNISKYNHDEIDKMKLGLKKKLKNYIILNENITNNGLNNYLFMNYIKDNIFEILAKK